MSIERLDIINEDGTKFDGFPFPDDLPDFYKDCHEYSCMWCDECPEGEFWKCPDELTDDWKKHNEIIDEYMDTHNPSLHKLKQKVKERK